MPTMQRGRRSRRTQGEGMGGQKELLPSQTPQSVLRATNITSSKAAQLGRRMKGGRTEMRAEGQYQYELT